MSSTIASRPRAGQTFSWFIFGLMSSVTFVGILSELVPSGILPQMAADLGIDEGDVGFLVGVYALASAVFAIPLVSATLSVNRKLMLQLLLAGFAVSNLVVAFASSYTLIVACRILGGICAGVMWPMIAAYGTRLVPENLHGRAITVIMAGNTLGISIGLPLMTTIGVTFGWRSAFAVLGLVVVVIGVLVQVFLPSVEGQRMSKANSPLAIVRMPTILIVLLLTFLSVIAHYGVYTYITLLVARLNLPGGIGLALLIFGIGSVISVILSARYIDAYLRPLIVTALVAGGAAMALFLAFPASTIMSIAGFFLWGLAFGPLVTMYQTAVSRQIDEAKDVATSVQSSVFNLSIMVGTWIGGLLLDGFLGSSNVSGVVWLSLGCFALATIVAFLSRTTLRPA
ncbi:major facilitator superfamily protein [Oceaniovalibus guishaninsula JLT2003]|uniref:Major facilitator superfamily protein n=1 Tax=Oceaniovalibus guishaninsula JLT2003 TaxID=1231392 RepID=K2GKA8_9RHOB|nr:MFS transporter [Oceaniovalibus guishaninsula]EKE43151.1 major facilitator superfamily protein [Oceaniovalibus guishaninsula JLT2003]